MKPEDLEQRLARTPRGGPPPAWRMEILAAAKVARAEKLAESSAAPATSRGRGDRGRRAPWWAAVTAWLRPDRVWASPWGVLAAGWMVVLGLHVTGAWIERSRPVAIVTVRSSPTPRPGSASAVLLAARHYRAEIVALSESDEIASQPVTEAAVEPTSKPSDRPPAARPRTERDVDRRGAALGATRWMV